MLEQDAWKGQPASKKSFECPLFHHNFNQELQNLLVGHLTPTAYVVAD